MAASNLDQNSTAHILPCTALLHLLVQDHLRRSHKSGGCYPTDLNQDNLFGALAACLGVRGILRFAQDDP